MRTVLCAALLSFSLATAAPAAAADDAKAHVTLDRGAARALLSWVNAERARHGVPAVVADPQLEAVAAAHSLRMGRTGVLEHNDGLFTRRMHAALRIPYFGENVGFDWSVPDAHRGFLRSARHRANLLRRDYRLAGFAVARDGAGAVWVTEDFGTARRGGTAARPSSRAAAVRPRSRAVPGRRVVVAAAAVAATRRAPARVAAAPRVVVTRYLVRDFAEGSGSAYRALLLGGGATRSG